MIVLNDHLVFGCLIYHCGSVLNVDSYSLCYFSRICLICPATRLSFDTHDVFQPTLNHIIHLLLDLLHFFFLLILLHVRRTSCSVIVEHLVQ